MGFIVYLKTAYVPITFLRVVCFFESSTMRNNENTKITNTKNCFKAKLIHCFSAFMSMYGIMPLPLKSKLFSECN